MLGLFGFLWLLSVQWRDSVVIASKLSCSMWMSGHFASAIIYCCCGILFLLHHYPMAKSSCLFAFFGIIYSTWDRQKVKAIHVQRNRQAKRKVGYTGCRWIKEEILRESKSCPCLFFPLLKIFYWPTPKGETKEHKRLMVKCIQKCNTHTHTNTDTHTHNIIWRKMQKT